MQCTDALQALTEPDPDRVDEAQAHVATCSACLSHFDQLARAILCMDTDEISCAECRARFPAYYEADRQGGTTSAGWSAVANHLARCPYCAEEYGAVQEVMLAWEDGALPEPATVQPPTFDLSFLGASSSEIELWLSTAAGRVRELFSEVVVTLGAQAASFAPLPPPLLPTPAPARVFRAEDDEAQAQVLLLPDPEADVSIQLFVGPVADDKAALAVKLGQIESREPLPDTRVMVYDAARRLLAGSVTDADGSVVFRDLHTGRYILQVRRDDQRWELALSIVRK